MREILKWKDLPAGEFRLERGADARLSLEAGGNKYEGVRLRPMFPLSRPLRWIQVSDADGGMLGGINDLAELPPELGTLLAEDIGRVLNISVIKTIHSIKSRYGIMDWDVETDRGRSVFEVNDRDHIREFPRNKIYVKDVEGNRYVIPDSKKLDVKSWERLEAVL